MFYMFLRLNQNKKKQHLELGIILCICTTVYRSEIRPASESFVDTFSECSARKLLGRPEDLAQGVQTILNFLSRNFYGYIKRFCCF